MKYYLTDGATNCIGRSLWKHNCIFKYETHSHSPINVSLLDDSLRVVEGMVSVLWSETSTRMLTRRFCSDDSPSSAAIGDGIAALVVTAVDVGCSRWPGVTSVIWLSSSATKNMRRSEEWDQTDYQETLNFK